MMRLATMIGLLLLWACHAPEETPLVLPGTFAESTTVADLEARFGKANVKVTTEADGDAHPGVILFPNDPTRRAYVTFHDAEALEQLASIEVRDAGSLWRGKQGVQIGMSFAELVKLNGMPFGYGGFSDEGRAWAREGWSPALDDDDGKLGRLDVEEGDHLYFSVDLGLRPGTPAEAYPHDEAQTQSADPQYPKLGELAYVTGFGAWSSLDDEWQ
ncbi:MAG TPA: hypothetical protein VGR62_15535 [Candidatus Binatia bacterium]|jgi:hypothetical protein|nr:hypothetical protein [Candidatus Binatia bacterium]